MEPSAVSADSTDTVVPVEPEQAPDPVPTTQRAPLRQLRQQAEGEAPPSLMTRYPLTREGWEALERDRLEGGGTIKAMAERLHYAGPCMTRHRNLIAQTLGMDPIEVSLVLPAGSKIALQLWPETEAGADLLRAHISLAGGAAALARAAGITPIGVVRRHWQRLRTRFALAPELEALVETLQQGGEPRVRWAERRLREAPGDLVRQTGQSVDDLARVLRIVRHQLAGLDAADLTDRQMRRAECASCPSPDADQPISAGGIGETDWGVPCPTLSNGSPIR